MCGRFVSASSPALLAERFAVDEVTFDDDEPHYNVAPRAIVPVVRERGGEHPHRALSGLRWGLVPSWAKDPAVGDRQINARAETLTTKPAFKRAFERRRCIVPADGFYEWQAVAAPAGESTRKPSGKARKQPYFVHRRDGEPMAFAGLWEVWKAPEGFTPIDGMDDEGWLRTCLIITTRANDSLAPIHDRMPVVLPESAWDRWLDRDEQDVAALEAMLVPAPDDWLEVYPVGTLVSDARNEGPELVRPVDVAASDSPGDSGDSAGDSPTLFS